MQPRAEVAELYEDVHAGWVQSSAVFLLHPNLAGSVGQISARQTFFSYLTDFSE